MKTKFLHIIASLFLGISCFAVDVTAPKPVVDANITLPAPNEKEMISPLVFGSNLFNGSFSQNRQNRYNPSYLINIGDVVSVKLWGAFDYDAMLTVDTQGNIFIPKVGTVNLQGVRNDQLNDKVTSLVKNVFKSNVFSYADLQNYQPVSIFVTGSVNKPGLYEGLSSDSIVQFIDKAKGIDGLYGSYRNIHIMRDNKPIKSFDLYAFLIQGNLELFQFRMGDVIVVDSVKSYVTVKGDVKRPFRFELKSSEISLKELSLMVVPNQTATNVLITKWDTPNERTASLHSLLHEPNLLIQSGQTVEFVPDHNAKDIVLYVEGEHANLHSVVLSKGATLKEVLEKITYTPLSDKESVQLYRKSVAEKQKQLLDAQLHDLEAKALTTSSMTSEESVIRAQEAKLILDFIQRARAIQPKGQVIINQGTDLALIALEEGDTIFVPAKNRTVVVQGEVMLPGAQTYVDKLAFQDYVASSGGYNSRANKEAILVVHQNGKAEPYDASSSFSSQPKVLPGDSILVLSKVETKDLQIAKDMTQILYQVAVGAAVVLKAW